MNNRSEPFARLLKGAVNSIAAYEGKTAPAIEHDLGEQIGVSGATVQRWKSGTLPTDERAVEILAEAAIRRGYLAREWLQRFLYAARYPFADKLLDQLCPLGPARSRPPRVYENLPAPTYSQFVMRQQPFADVIDGLQQRSAVVLIVGLGGNGKTSLAREVAARCLQNDSDAPRFDAVVWVSDKGRPGTTNLSSVLDEIARTLDYPRFTQFAHDEKCYEVGQLLKRQRVLLVVDNFETITDGALLTWLLRLPEPSKAIVTSREYGREYRRGGWPVELRGMSDAEAHEFVNQRLRVLRIERLVSDQTRLEPLLAATGGNPKAIEIALGLVKHERRPLQQVVDDLYAARGDLFDDLFTRAWALLDEAARRVLLVMTFFPASASGEALSATADVQGFAFDRAVERLTDLALLDEQRSSLASAPRYVLHPLVQAFAIARLHEVSEFIEQTRTRWTRYFLDFTSRHCLRNVPKERYWNSLENGNMPLLDPEWPNLLNVLSWADESNEYRTLIEMMMLLVHAMDRRALLSERIDYAQKAAEAANMLGQKVDEALFRIDALGWILIEEGRLTDAERQITVGLQIAERLGGSVEANDLIALACAFLARVYFMQEEVDRASELINKAMSIDCRNVISRRVTMAAGELAYKKKDHRLAIKLYEDALNLERQYNGEGDLSLYQRLGFTYLAQGELAQAEAEFKKLLALKGQIGSVDFIYGKYGLACIEKAKGKLDKAYRLAQDAFDELSRLHIGHRHVLLNDIKVLLASFDTPPVSSPNIA